MVVINELAWMGTENSFNDEWIELYNPGDYPVNLDAWTIQTKDESLKIKLSGSIGAKSYFLLERTDDSTIPEIIADIIYKGGLNNQGKQLLLLDNIGQVVDNIDCSLGWFAGNNENKKTMERIVSHVLGSDPNNWKTSQSPGGTPKSENSPNENIVPKKELIISDKNYKSSKFAPVLSISIGASACISVVFSAIWLKIRKKSSKIKYQ
ncbi:lamin tail domain-containing protein [Patescibacteria group bacterium]|nr:lamin tail domain-containing protein [Patescibacteria group bacterium]MBU4162039.1 lamin tail domain-containing protein [Patescibacteria group bacterium]